MTKEEEGLVGASELLTALMASSYCVRSFQAKWRSIREKLERLSALIAEGGGDELAFSSSSSSSSTSSLCELLREIQNLAHRCAKDRVAGGKLQLRSDIDLVFSKLEHFVEHLEGVEASVALKQSKAIVTSRPVAGACREDMRFFANDIFLRLKVGDHEIRHRALMALNEAFRFDEKYINIAALEIPDGVGILVSLLKSGHTEIQEEASAAVTAIVGFEAFKGALVSAGAIGVLVRVLETGSRVGRERAAEGLKKLTENSENVWAVASHGGVTALLDICGGEGNDGELVCLACRSLRNLSGVSEVQKFMVEQGAISIFLRLLISKEEGLRIQALEFLNTLASDEEFIKKKVINSGFASSFLQFLDPKSDHSTKARELSMRSIELFCFNSVDSINDLIGFGYIHKLLFFLVNGEASTQELVLKAALRLSGVSEETKKEMGELGFIPVLVSLLGAKSFELCEMAAAVLCSLLSLQRNRRRFMREEENLSRVLQLLNPEEDKSATKNLLSVLLSLTESSSGRKKIVASGCVKHLERLAATGDLAAEADARKIVRKLSGNRFWKAIQGIWN